MGGPGGVARSYILGQYSVLFDGREDGVTFLRFVRFFTIFFFRNVCLFALTFCLQKDFPKAERLSGLPFFWFF